MRTVTTRRSRRGCARTVNPRLRRGAGVLGCLTKPFWRSHEAICRQARNRPETNPRYGRPQSDNGGVRSCGHSSSTYSTASLAKHRCPPFAARIKSWLDARQTEISPACDPVHMRHGRALLANTQIASSGGLGGPDDSMRNGRACGGRSAYSRPGGAAPLCYPSDVTAAMIGAYRQRTASR